MVAIATKTYSTDERARAARPTPLGLSGKHRSDLEAFFCAYESDIGIRSTHSAMIAAWNGLGTGHVVDPHEAAAKLVDSGATKRANLVRGALRRIDTGHVVVLYRVCGPRNPLNEHACFGDLAPLADMTAAVEAAREHAACSDGLTRERDVSDRLDAAPEKLEELAGTFWEAAGEEEALRHKAEIASDEKHAESLTLHADGWFAVQERALAEYQLRASMSDQGRLSARLTALASADLELTPAAILREMLTKSRAADKAARAAHDAQRREFVASVTREVTRLWIAASGAYREALGGRP